MPISKTCKVCGEEFEITNSDIAFYKKISPEINGEVFLIPPPTLCHNCREKRRWAFRNQSTLYKRTCDATGEKIISLYSSDKPYTVYSEKFWWSDKWDPLSSGFDYNFAKSFFVQFFELFKKVPRRGMYQDGTCENCLYTTFGFANKDCYCTYACFNSQNLSYSTLCGMLQDSADCFMCVEGQLLYECLDCKKCYNLSFCQECINCSDSILIEDCRNCTNCIACKNLEKKNYHIYNKPVTKEEFEIFRKKVLTNPYGEKEKFDLWKIQLPNLNLKIYLSEDCIGNHIEHSKNCKICFDMILSAEDCKYCRYSGWKSKDMMDCSMCGQNSELLYEMQAVTNTNKSAFCNFCRNCSDVYYCDCISSCNYCFGCTGLRHKNFCILNKQYTKEQYFELLPKIIKHMQETNEWGEFFPIEFSPFKYEETMANFYFPLQ